MNGFNSVPFALNKTQFLFTSSAVVAISYSLGQTQIESVLQVWGPWMEAWELPWPMGQQPAPWMPWPRLTQGCSSTQPPPCPPSTASLSCNKALLAARRKVSGSPASTRLLCHHIYMSNMSCLFFFSVIVCFNVRGLFLFFLQGLTLPFVFITTFYNYV